MRALASLAVGLPQHPDNYEVLRLWSAADVTLSGHPAKPLPCSPPGEDRNEVLHPGLLEGVQGFLSHLPDLVAREILILLRQPFPQPSRWVVDNRLACRTHHVHPRCSREVRHATCNGHPRRICPDYRSASCSIPMSTARSARSILLAVDRGKKVRVAGILQPLGVTPLTLRLRDVPAAGRRPGLPTRRGLARANGPAPRCPARSASRGLLGPRLSTRRPGVWGPRVCARTIGGSRGLGSAGTKSVAGLRLRGPQAAGDGGLTRPGAGSSPNRTPSNNEFCRL